MNKYEVTRTYTTTEYCVVYANSEKEAKEKAIKNEDNWDVDDNLDDDPIYNVELV